MRAFRGDRGLLSKPRRLRNGFLQADAYLTRVGVFEYRNLDGTVRRELRLPDEVFRGDSISTFAMAPVTMGHPSEPVTASNAGKYQIGYTGQDVRRDGEKMRATVMITDAPSIDKMKRGRREISNGYFCDLEMTSGVTSGLDGIPDGLEYDCIQRNIEGNHVAVVDRGRAGPDVNVRVDAIRLDGVDDIAWSELRYDDGSSDELDGSGDGDGGENENQDVSRPTNKPHADVSEHVGGSSSDSLLPINRDAGAGAGATALAESATVAENDGANVAGRSADTKDQLPDGQRVNTDREESKMKRKINIDGITFEFEADDTAHAAITKAIDGTAAKLDEAVQAAAKADAEHDAALQAEKARADAAEEAKAKAEAERDAATDPAAIRARIDERLELERSAADILGDEFDATKTDGELREAVILKVQPSAKLDGKADAYVAARFDAAVELHKESAKNEPPKHVQTRRAAASVKGDSAGDIDPVTKARQDAMEKRRNMWRTPCSATKDGAPDNVRIGN